VTVLLVVATAVVGLAVGGWWQKRRVGADATLETLSNSGDGDSAFDVVGRAVEVLDIGVVVASAAGEIVYRNRVASGMTGALHADVLVEEAVDVHLRGALDGQTRRQIIELFGPPLRVVSVSATPLEGGGAVATIEDVTERARLDAVRTDFVANISHELKTPVGALAVLAEAMADADEPEVINRLANKMVDEAFRAGRTIDDLLELSRIELGGDAVRDVVPVSLVMAEAVDRARSLAERRGIDIRVNEVADRLKLLGDRRQLVSAVGNLVENAVKYSESGGQVEISAHTDGIWIDLRVRDFGFGIPARDLDRIFERFYRVDRARSRETGGTGLGLAIVRHVANNHGGEVRVKSVEGEGSTFDLRIPAAPGLASASLADAG
jgi:two-component system, OmpR family, sensor histidine kinase SenX3